MIKFFRKIRQNLLSEGKTGKYFKYAIGEIILVVIGILIALQINNWNENNKKLEIEYSILNELLNESKTNILSLEEDIYLNKRSISSNVLIKDVLTKGITYHDSLNVHFGNIQYNTEFSISTAGFENLKSRGFEIISNDSVRRSILDLYDRWYDFIGVLGDKNNKISIEQFDPQYKVYFTDFKRNMPELHISCKPLNYDNLIGNNNFIRLVSYQKYNNEYTIQVLETGIEQIEELIQKLESELKSFSNN